MAAIVSNNFRSLNAKNFMADVRTEQSNVYIGVGKTTAWQDAGQAVLTDYSDTQPNVPTDTIDHINQARANMIGMKLILNDDVSHVVPRYDWEIDAEFVPWDSRNENIYDDPFYCLTPDFKVYKCIDAPASGGVQDVPISTSSSIIATTDGYRWKYMYTIIAADAEKFLTRSYMPVKTLTVSTTGVNSADVAANATTMILTTENPNIMVGQKMAGGTLQTGASTTPIVTAISGKTITFSPAHAGGVVTANQSITFGAFADTNPLRPQQLAQANSVSTKGSIDRIVIENAGANYGTNLTTIATNLIIVGDGSGATIDQGDVGGGEVGIAVNNGNINRLIPKTSGSGYSVAQVIEKAGSPGSGLVAYPVISPPSGHGVDPVAELGGFYIGLNTQISGIDDTDIANNQDFRQISIIKNPLVSGLIETTAVAAARPNNTNRGTFRTTKFHNYKTSGANAATEISNILATGADVLLIDNQPNATSGNNPRGYITNIDTTNRIVYYVQDELTGYDPFVSEAVCNFQSGAAPVNSTLLLNLEDGSGAGEEINQTSGPDRGTGEILFLENRAPIQRSSTQIEDVKLILEF